MGFKSAKRWTYEEHPIDLETAKVSGSLQLQERVLSGG